MKSGPERLSDEFPKAVCNVSVTEPLLGKITEDRVQDFTPFGINQFHSYVSYAMGMAVSIGWLTSLVQTEISGQIFDGLL